MIYGNYDFLDLKYKPKATEVVCEFRIKPKKGDSLIKAAEYVTGESSIGTWTKIQTMNPVLAKKLKPTIFYANKKTFVVKIAYPEELFEPGNMPGILSSIAGNIFGMKDIDALRLEDIHFTKKLVKSFLGPQFGIKGIRKMTNIRRRPLIGTIVKPKVGLTEKEHAKVAYESWLGGLDVVKDDENLVSMSFNNFYIRIKEVYKKKNMVEKQTGKQKIYLPNITAEVDEMKKRANAVKKLGGRFVMVDILTAGFSALQTIRAHTEKLGLAIHAHRAMHGAITRNKDHGISMLVIAKIARLIGVDTLHIGTAGFGKMEAGKDEVLKYEQEVEFPNVKEDIKKNVLGQEYFGLKPTLAVASGGISPISIRGVMRAMGDDIVMQFGGGCHGHPQGTLAGAKAIKQALDAEKKGISIKEAVKNNPKKNQELALAIDKWG